MAQNKSKIAREFWRDIIDNNKIDLSNSDARKSVVSQFLNDPENKNWRSADRRFFRLAFDKICKERGINSHHFGVKPEPKRVKTKSGQMNIHIKTDEKKVHPLFRKEEAEKEKEQEAKEEPKHDVKTAEQLQRDEQAAAIYTGDSVAGIFDMMFNLLHSRYPACSQLSLQERKSLGEAWYPIFNEFLGGAGSKWIMPIVVTAPIVIVRFSEYARKKKEDDIKDEILHDLPRDKLDEPVEPKKTPDKKWSEKL